MQFFVSKNHNNLNRRPFSPETINPRLCLNPKYGVRLARPAGDLEILLDSGAFQDISDHKRLSFDGALQRQLTFEQRVGFQSKYIVSYDRIVDETFNEDGKRVKLRVDGRTARKYVDETVDAAKHLADQRRELKPRRLVLSNQGVSPGQYSRCVKEVLSFSEKNDVIGLGGQCIIGQRPGLTADYFEVLRNILPLIHRKGIRRLHVFGVGTFPVLVKTQALCSKFGIVPSYDTSALEINARWGKITVPPNVQDWLPTLHVTRVFGLEDKFELFHPRDLALLNIRIATNFWEEIDKMYPLRTNL
jgi:hypothetical protein